MQASATRADTLPLAAARTRLRAFPLVLAACVGLGSLSLALPSSPTYDAWAWLIWGREITELDLNTEHGPSWKPLPVLFTTVFAFFGDAAPALWLVVARAGALLGVVMAFRVSARLAGGTAGVLAGAVAALGLVVSDGWLRHAWLGNSEGVLIALALWAVERHLHGERGQAFALGFAAALLRPEVWPFLGLYALYLWFAEPRRRPLVALLSFLVAAAWFLPDLVATGDPLRSSARAQSPNPWSPAFAANPALEIVESAREIPIAPIEAGALVAFVIALPAFLLRRRDGGTLALALAAAALVGIVALMTEQGFSGNPRYLLLPAALAAVVAGVGWARVAQAAGLAAAELTRRTGAATAAAVVVSLLVAAATLAHTEPRARWIVESVPALEYAGHLYTDLGAAVDDARDAGVLECGRAFTGPFQVTALAWHLHVHIGRVALEPRPPGVVFRVRPDPARARLTPPVPPSQPPFRRVASAGDWEVLAACAKGPSMHAARARM